MEEIFFTEKIDITPNTLIADLIERYPHLEDKLIEIAPVFKKLKNPVLRRTIAKVTNLRQAAVVANINLGELINKIRAGAGQSIQKIEEVEGYSLSEKPEWLKEYAVKIIYDAREGLENGIHPIAKVLNDIKNLNEGEIYLLITPFIPAPLIDILQQKTFNTYTVEAGSNEVKTFISTNTLN